MYTISVLKLSYRLYTFSIQLHAVVGVLLDDTDPMVSVMKLEKAPQESYADIGGLDQQIQEIKVCIHLSAFCLLDGWIDGLMDGWTDGWMDVLMDGWTNGWI